MPHHVTQRGNYRQQVFFREGDRRLYCDLLRQSARHYGVAIQAYCLMPNHVHLIVVPHSAEALARTLQQVHSAYARVLHVRLGRAGHLWQARYYSVPLDEEHFWAAMVYVEQNPVRAGLVNQPQDWKWSSARAHLQGRDEGWLDLVTWRSAYEPSSWSRALGLGLRNAALLERIREATTSGWPLGSDAFLDRLERDFGIHARRSKPGRKQVPRTAASAEIGN